MRDCAAPVVCRDLVYRFRNGACGTDHVSLTLERGDLFCLLGPNGAGKTTLIRQIVGDLRPTSGAVSLFGEDPSSRRAQARRRLGWIPQHVGLFPMLTVAEHLRTLGRIKGLTAEELPKAIERVAKPCGVEHLFARRAVELSGGQQRSTLLALALLADPDVLVLDEPTVGLDPASRHAVWDVIGRLRAAGKTILLTTHYLDEAEHLANRIGFLSAGALTLEGTLNSLYASLGQSVRVLVGGDANPLRPPKARYFDTLEEAQAFARSHGRGGCMINRVSLEELYLRVTGDAPPAEPAFA